jgi:hypothetical protein
LSKESKRACGCVGLGELHSREWLSKKKSCPKNAIGVLADTAAHALTTIQFADSLVQKSLVASKKFELIILLG